jgi:hypothetical protein
LCLGEKKSRNTIADKPDNQKRFHILPVDLFYSGNENRNEKDKSKQQSEGSYLVIGIGFQSFFHQDERCSPDKGEKDQNSPLPPLFRKIHWKKFVKDNHLQRSTSNNQRSTSNSEKIEIEQTRQVVVQRSKSKKINHFLISLSHRP